MSNESLTIQKDDARQSVVGKCWPDTSWNSGDGEWDDTWDDDPPDELPTSIKIVMPPSKTEFKDGDPITFWDYFDIVIYAYKEDGTLWDEDDYYPGGRVYAEDIEVEPNVAKYDGKGAILYGPSEEVAEYYGRNDNIYVAKSAYRIFPFGDAQTIFHEQDDVITGDCYLFIKDAGPTANVIDSYFITRENAEVHYEWYSEKTPSNIHEGTMYIDKSYGWRPYWNTSHFGVEYCQTNILGFGSHWDDTECSPPIMNGGIPFSYIADVLWHDGTMLGAVQVITVKWRRPYDGVELTDTYEITVTKRTGISDGQPGNGGR